MGNLQYDSFYKFMVSAGVVLVAAPLIGLHYLLCNGNQILLSQNEYNELSYSSMQFVQRRDQTILNVLRVLPWLLAGLIFIGLLCLIYGSIKWHNIQKEIDQQTKLKTQEQQIKVEKLSVTEVAEKVINEVADEQDNQPFNDSNPSLEKSRVTKTLEVENLCYKFIYKKYSRSYNILQNIKIDKYACDILAVSMIDRIDYLYEIKYWKSCPSKTLMNCVVNNIEALRSAYETKSQRFSRSILMIVTLDETKSSFQEFFHHYVINQSMPFDFCVYTESELK